MNKYGVMIHINDESKAFLDKFSTLTGCSYRMGNQYGTDTYVEFSIDNDAIKNVTSRNAGRRTKTTGFTCSEIYHYREMHTQMETASHLGVNIRTYQRMEKSVKDAGFWYDGSEVPFQRYDAKL